MVTTEPCLQLRVDHDEGGVMLRTQRFPDALPAPGMGNTMGTKRGKASRKRAGAPESTKSDYGTTDEKMKYIERFGQQGVVQPGDFFANKTVYQFKI